MNVSVRLAAMEKQLNELRQLAARAENRRTETGIPRVVMVQGAIPEHELAAVYEPMINLILQGGKTITVGDRAFHYDPATYFVMSIDLPAAGAVHPASTGEPYLSLGLMLDSSRIATLLEDVAEESEEYGRGGFAVAAVTPELLDAWVRMLRLMDNRADIPALAPVYEREILYRVLQGPLGWMLRDIATPDTALARVSRAIHWIRQNFDKPLVIEALANMVAMSASAFHRHFKAVTALSPLQYQKRIRLLQARRLLISGAGNAMAVAFDVGYESATQFNREYARFFGMPPGRDLERILRELRGAR